MPDIEITSDGEPLNTRVTIDGHEIRVTEIDWHISRNTRATAHLTLPVLKLETIAGDVIWHGLEDVPTDALTAELERRQDDEETGR